MATAGTLIDAGEHLRHLADRFQVTGADQSAGPGLALGATARHDLPPGLCGHRQRGHGVAGGPRDRRALDVHGASSQIGERGQRIGGPVRRCR